MDKTHENILNDTGAYVLNTMSPAERADFESALKHSPEARQEVVELGDTASILSEIIPPITPSVELKQRLMNQIASLPQVQAEPAAVQREPSQSHAEGAGTRFADWLKRFRFPLVAIPAMLVAGAVIVPLTNQPASSPQNAYSSITAADDMKTFKANTTNGGSVTVLWSADQKKAAIQVHQLPPLQSSQTYEAWLIKKDGTAVPAGLFTAADDHSLLNGTYTRGDSIGVTVEPKEGSTAPTTKPILLLQT